MELKAFVIQFGILVIIPLFVTNPESSIKGKSDGISTCRHKKIPFVKPFLHSVGNISSKQRIVPINAHISAAFVLSRILYIFILFTD